MTGKSLIEKKRRVTKGEANFVKYTLYSDFLNCDSAFIPSKYTPFHQIWEMVLNLNLMLFMSSKYGLRNNFPYV